MTRTAWRPCARRWDRGRRCAWTRTGRGRWMRRFGRSGGMEEYDLELVEQPCRSLRELAEVRQRVSTPIAADESVGSLRELRRAVELEACDVVNVKLAGAGGFKPARELLREARSHGLGAFLSSTLDGPWGIAAALQLAAPRSSRWPAASRRWTSSIPRWRRRCRGRAAGRSPCRAGPGLGVSIEAEDLAAVTSKRSPKRLSPGRPGTPRAAAPPLPAAAGAPRGRPPPRSPRGRSAPSRRFAWPRGCSRRRGRPAIASTGSSSCESSCQTGSSTPWPAVRSSSASERWSCESRPGRCASTSASDWSANSGWRSHTDTTSSIDAASIHDASRSSASARAARNGPSSMPAVAPTSTTPLKDSGERSAARSASRPPSE